MAVSASPVDNPFYRLELSTLWSLIEMGANGAWLWEVEADRVSWSPKLCSFLNCFRAPKVLADLLHMTHPADRESYEAKLTDAIRLGDSFRANIRLRDGEGRYVEVRSAAMPVHASKLGGRAVVGLVLDRNDEAGAESELVLGEAHLRAAAPGRSGVEGVEPPPQTEAAQALERRLIDHQRLESLGLLAGSIAHNFNNIIHTILGNAELVAVVSAQEQGEYLEAIRERCRHAGKLCSQLLLYAGRGQAQLEPIDAGQLIDASGELLDISRHQGTSLRFEVAPDLPEVRADPTQLRQILLNLVLNAAQAVDGRDNRELVVKCEVRPRVHPREILHEWTDETAGPFVCISVSDSGPGMTVEQAQKAFEPFYSTKLQGHGLGLPTVLGLVRAHLGAISVLTAPDQGTSVEVYLPVGGGESPSDRPTPAMP